MGGLLDTKRNRMSSPVIASMSAPRIFSKRGLLLLLVLSSFVGILLLTARNMGQLCEDGGYCNISGLRKKPPRLGNDDRNSTADGNATSTIDECANFPNVSNILTIMKTGASEAYARIPTQLMTSLKCRSATDFLLFSDLEQEIVGHKMHDALEKVDDEFKKSNKDFALYLRQQQCPVNIGECNKPYDVAREGWELDKYKNTHMAEKTYQLRPNYDWYLFVDADTYVLYSTMAQWLKHLDPQKKHYIGSVAYLGDIPFGHGGSGYLVSQAAMHAMFHGKERVGNRWDEPVSKICCGDVMWSYALKEETGTAIVNAWPIINGEKPNTFPYGPQEWCQPVTTMHHVSAEEISDLYAFEKERNFEQPMHFKDVFKKFVEPFLTERRDDWDNLSEDTTLLNPTMGHYEDWELDRAKKEGLTEKEEVAWKSLDACKEACSSLDHCIQYRYHRKICYLNHNFKFGKAAKKEEDEDQRQMSGWNIEKMKVWMGLQKCDEKWQWPIRDHDL